MFEVGLIFVFSLYNPIFISTLKIENSSQFTVLIKLEFQGPPGLHFSSCGGLPALKHGEMLQHHPLIDIDRYWGILRDIEGYWDVLRDIEGYWGILRYIEGYWEILRDIERHWEILRYIVEYWVMLRDIERYWEISRCWDIERY